MEKDVKENSCVQKPYIYEKKEMCVPDMHAHLSCLAEEYGKGLSMAEARALGEKELEIRREQGIASFFSCGTPREWEFMQKYRERKDGAGTAYKAEISLSFGIHPWYSDQYRPEDYMEYFRACDAVGEIGLDSVWCKVPLAVQRAAFEQQLRMAADLHKSIVLHTKGQEALIAEMIREFPGNVCVHWYSGDIRSLDKFLELGCYFTLGPDMADVCAGLDACVEPDMADMCGEPDVCAEPDMADVCGGPDVCAEPDMADVCEETDTAGVCAPSETAENIIGRQEAAARYRYMLVKIPADRLFIETDGISAVAWAKGVEYLPLEEIPAVLKKNLAYAAKWKKISPEQMGQQMMRNWAAFLNEKK